MTEPIEQCPPPPSRADQLRAKAAEARELRELATNPDIIALRVERVRAQVDAMAWAGIVLGMAFTMTNVQRFAAGDAPHGSPTWWASWLLDPTPQLVLLAVLRAEQVAARWLIPLGAWPRLAKWGCLGMTYAMNVWESVFGPAGFTPPGVLKHSVPVVVVFLGAEAITDAREALTRAVLRAAEWDTDRHRLPASEPTRMEPVAPLVLLRPIVTLADTIARNGFLPPPPVSSNAPLGQEEDQEEPQAEPETVDDGENTEPMPAAGGTPPPAESSSHASGERPREEPTKTARARAWVFERWASGEDPTLAAVNAAVGSDNLVKRPTLDGWQVEYDADTTTPPRRKRPGAALTAVQ